MHTESDGQLNIRSAAWSSNKHKIVAIFCFSKHLMQIDTEPLRTNNCKMNLRKERNSTRFLRGGMQYQRTRFRKEVIRFRDPQITKRHFILAGIRGYQLYTKRIQDLTNPQLP